MKAFVKCGRCGERAELGFVLKDNKVVNSCKRCMEDIGKAQSDEEKDKIINELKGEA